MAIADILHGPVAIKYAPVGTALPADSVAFGGVWPTGWLDFGYTQAPLTLNYTFDELDIEVEQELAPLDRIRIKETVELSSVLAELTAKNVGVMMNGIVTLTDAGAKQVGKEEVEVGGDRNLNKYAFAFEGLYIDSTGNKFPRRFFLYRGTCRVDGEIASGKEANANLPFTIKGLVDTSKSSGKNLFKWQTVKAAATA